MGEVASGPGPGISRPGAERPPGPRPAPDAGIPGHLSAILIVEDQPELVRALRRPAQLVGSAQLLDGVWGFRQRTNYLRFHMARLRRKLEENPTRPRHLLTEPGMGYRFQP